MGPGGFALCAVLGCFVRPWAAAFLLLLLVVPRVFRAPEGLTCRAGLLCAPVGGGPPARRPRRELRSARRLEARPGPATAHGHRSLALRSLRRPPHQWDLVCWRVAWCVGSKPRYSC